MSSAFQSFESRGFEAFIESFQGRGSLDAIVKDVTGDQFQVRVLSSTLNQVFSEDPTPRVLTVTGFIVNKGLEGFFLHCFQRRGQGNDGSATFADEGFTLFGLLQNAISNPTTRLSDIVTGGDETVGVVGATDRIEFKNSGQRLVRTVIDGGNLRLNAEFDFGFLFDTPDNGALPDIEGLFLTPNRLVGNHASLNQLFAIFDLSPPAVQFNPQFPNAFSNVTGTIKLQFEIIQ